MPLTNGETTASDPQLARTSACADAGTAKPIAAVMMKLVNRLIVRDITVPFVLVGVPTPA
jgi:hypothetical protein